MTAVYAPALTEISIDLRQEGADRPPQPLHGSFTLMAVFDGERWASLCRELDIASEGASFQEALDTLGTAVREAIEVAASRGVEAGEPVSDEALLEFLAQHTGTAPVYGAKYLLP
jgi:hypothetical protein